MSGMVIFILYALSTNGIPSFDPLADFPTKDACITAAANINSALETGKDHGATVVCISADSLDDLAKANNLKG